MAERELTTENVGELLKPKSKQDEPEPVQGEPIASEPTEPTEPKLSADDRELMARYRLPASAVKRIRGDTWSERCSDASRLAESLAAAEPQVNAGELAALARQGEYNSSRTLVEMLHPSTKKAEGDEGGDGKGGEDS